MLQKQTANFPPISLPEMSWGENLRAALQLRDPIPAIASGLNMGLPMTAGQPVAGATPTLTDGYLVHGDLVMGPYGSKLISAAPVNGISKFWFGLEGAYWSATPNTPKDVLIGVAALSNDDPAHILHVAQPIRSSSGFYGIRGLVNLQRCAKGTDVDLITWEKPVGMSNLRIVYAHARVMTIVTGGNTAGDDFLLKVGSATLVTKDDANLVTAGHTDVASSLPTYGAATESLVFKYQQVDTATLITGGTMEVCALFEAF